MKTEGMKKSISRSMVFLILGSVILPGCALVKPSRHYEEATPVDWGLAGAYLSTVTVAPFTAGGNEEWGGYAARMLAEYLMENMAFRQVVVAEGDVPKTSYFISGTLDHLSYGGNEDSTTVFLTVKVISTSDSQVRFHRSAKASSRKSAFHVAWLRSVDVPSPYIEEVLNGILKDVASDIASRTHSPAVQNP